MRVEWWTGLSEAPWEALQNQYISADNQKGQLWSKNSATILKTCYKTWSVSTIQHSSSGTLWDDSVHPERFDFTAVLQHIPWKWLKNDSKVTRLDSQSDNDFDWLWMTQSEDLTLQQSYSIFHESRLRMTQYDSESDKWLKLTLNDSEWLRMTRSDSKTCCKAQDSGLITHHWYLIRQSPAFPSRFIKSSEKGHQIHTAQSRNPRDKKKGHHRITIYSS